MYSNIYSTDISYPCICIVFVTETDKETDTLQRYTMNLIVTALPMIENKL